MHVAKEGFGKKTKDFGTKTILVLSLKCDNGNETWMPSNLKQKIEWREKVILPKRSKSEHL